MSMFFAMLGLLDILAAVMLFLGDIPVIPAAVTNTIAALLLVKGIYSLLMGIK